MVCYYSFCVPFGGFADFQQEHSITFLRAQRQKNEVLNMISVRGRRVNEIGFAGSKNDEEQVQKHADMCVAVIITASQDCGRNNTGRHAHD